jgi:hypothetical protein
MANGDFGRALGGTLQNIGRQIPVFSEARRRRRLEDEDRLLRQERQELNDFLAFAALEQEREAQGFKQKQDVQEFKQDIIDRNRRRFESDRAFEEGKRQFDLEQGVRTSKERRLGAPTAKGPTAKGPTAREGLFARNILETEKGRLGTNILGRLRQINPEAFEDIEELSNDPVLLRQLAESEDFQIGGGDRPGLFTGDFPAEIDPELAATLDTLDVISSTPGLDVARQIQGGGQFDLSEIMLERDIQRGNLTTEVDALGRTRHGEEWDDLTDQQKILILQDDQRKIDDEMLLGE